MINFSKWLFTNTLDNISSVSSHFNSIDWCRWVATRDNECSQYRTNARWQWQSKKKDEKTACHVSEFGRGNQTERTLWNITTDQSEESNKWNWWIFIREWGILPVCNGAESTTCKFYSPQCLGYVQCCCWRRWWMGSCPWFMSRNTSTWNPRSSSNEISNS